ncbi:unnamed protein product [Arabidopsis lyrata]|nr:unnamed protein product [Arabidopsis lyrata]
MKSRLACFFLVGIVSVQVMIKRQGHQILLLEKYNDDYV